ncbi:Platinum sensitivity protein [Umbelopsis sp. WA50703]
MATSVVSLPPPEISNLNKIEAIIKDCVTLDQKERLSSFVIMENYIDSLLPVFETCEDLEDLDGLHVLHNIMKSIILLNDNNIIEHVIKDEIILGVVGILEYDPQFPKLKANHREFLADNSKFKQVVPIRDKSVESKIHQTFRLQYLKDVILARVFDDPTFSIINSMIFFNHVDIVTHLQSDSEFLNSLFNILADVRASIEKKREVVLFVQEFCTIAKNLQIAARAEVYNSLCNHGLFQIFECSLTDTDVKVRLAGAEILESVLEHDSDLVRSFIVDQSKRDPKDTSTSLIEVIIEQFINDKDEGIKMQYAEVMRALLDTNAGIGESVMAEISRDSDAGQFLVLFYDKYMVQYVKPLLDIETKPMPINGDVEDLALDRYEAESCLHICDMLCFAIRQHGIRSKYFMLSSPCFSKVAQLLRCRQLHVKAAAIRVFRACVGTKDDFYLRNLIKNQVFEPIMRTLLDTQGRDNLLNSSILELLEFIRKENLKLLVSHIVNQFGDTLDSLKYSTVFAQLRTKYDQNVDPDPPTEEPVVGTANAAAVKHEGWGSETVNDQEEEYFNTSDEESIEAPAKPLVDYEDEEDEVKEAQPNNKEEQAEPDTLEQEENQPSEEKDEKTEEDKQEIKKADEVSQGDRPPPPPPKRQHSDEDDDGNLLAARATRRAAAAAALNTKKQKFK